MLLIIKIISMKIKVDIVTPVHNEGETIKKTLVEFYNHYSDSNFEIHFIVSEDGSSDDSVRQINLIKENYSLTLLSESYRKGYSKAVIDGLNLTKNKIVSFIDSDGQCDPADLDNLFSYFNGSNLVVGYRNPRQDKMYRIAMSNMFKIVYKILFKINLRDPSCPFFITSKENIERILSTDEIGILSQGFWWEFYARAVSMGIDIVETPINHRQRSGGKTVVYRPTKIPSIALKHLIGLFKLKKICNNFIVN